MRCVSKTRSDERSEVQDSVARTMRPEIRTRIWEARAQHEHQSSYAL